MIETSEPRHSVAFLIGWKAATMILVVLLAAFAVGGWRLNTIQNENRHRALVARCDEGNAFRVNDKARWMKLLEFAGPPRTPEAKRIVGQFVIYINRADRLVDCSLI